MKQIFHQVLEKIMNYCKRKMKRLQLKESNCETINLEEYTENQTIQNECLSNTSSIDTNDRTKSSSNKSESLGDFDKIVTKFNSMKLIPEDLNADFTAKHSKNRKSTNFPILEKKALNLLNRYILLI